MYLLFECGICSSLYQVQVEKFSNALQKVVCPSCQSFHYFGATQEDKVGEEPTIENVYNQNAKLPAIDPKFDQRSVSQEIYWRCGVCESNYHFNLNRVTAQGIKVTCTTCFSFFVLQKVGIMVDLDHMVMHEVSPDKALPSHLPPDQLAMIPPMIDENEVSGKFNIHTLQEALDLEESKQAETTKVEVSIPPTSPKAKPAVVPPPPTPSIQPKTNPYIQSPIPPRSPAVTSTSATQPGVKLPESKIAIKENDQVWVNSFKSFSTKKNDFKLKQPIEVSSVAFLEHNPQRKDNVIERNLIKISMWVAGISVFSLTVVFAYDWYEARKIKNAPPPPVTAPAQTAPVDPSKPQYGFPTLEE